MSDPSRWTLRLLLFVYGALMFGLAVVLIADLLEAVAR